MNFVVRQYQEKDVAKMTEIWNQVIEDGVAFPQLEGIKAEEASAFFAANNYCGVAVDAETDEVLGLYTLHPNNVGRCGHLANASYAVDRDHKGLHIGEALVKDCLVQGKACGFKVLQFNAVVDSNIHARHLYERLGFTELGVVPGGFYIDDGHYEDIHLFYHEL